MVSEVWRTLLEQPGSMVLPLVVLTIAGGLAMIPSTRAMKRTGGPGIVPFELAEDVREVHRIFTRWGEAGRRAARTSLLIDLAWIPLYALTLHTAARSAAHATAPQAAWLTALATAAVWGAVVAGALDVVENGALLRQLRTGPSAPAIRVAHVSARMKFALVPVVAIYALIGWGVANLAG